MIETVTYRLRDGADEAAFLTADEAMQIGFANLQPGLRRRTTARGADGWIEITVWDSAEQADAAAVAAAVAAEQDPLVAALKAFVEPASVVRARYETL